MTELENKTNMKIVPFKDVTNACKSLTCVLCVYHPTHRVPTKNRLKRKIKWDKIHEIQKNKKRKIESVIEKIPIDKKEIKKSKYEMTKQSDCNHSAENDSSEINTYESLKEFIKTHKMFYCDDQDPLSLEVKWIKIPEYEEPYNEELDDF